MLGEVREEPTTKGKVCRLRETRAVEARGLQAEWSEGLLEGDLFFPETRFLYAALDLPL